MAFPGRKQLRCIYQQILTFMEVIQIPLLFLASGSGFCQFGERHKKL